MPSAAKIDCVVSTISSNRSEPGGSCRQYSKASHAEASAATCSGAVIFGSVTTKFGGSTPSVRSSRRVRNRSKVRRLRRLSSSFSGLMRMPIDGGSVPALQARGHFVRGDLRVAVLLMIGAAAEAVLEVDAEILDRLARELVAHAGVDAIGRGGLGADHRGQGGGVRGVLVERPECHRPELLRRVSLEEVRAAVDRVDRLALGRVAGKQLREADVALVQRVQKRGHRVLGNRRVGHGPASIVATARRAGERFAA